MKQFFNQIVAAVAVSAVAMGANAQSDKEYTGYNRVSVGYEANFLGGDGSRSFNDKGDKGATFNGFNVQYIHGFHITNSLPLYIETGARLNTGFLSVDDVDVTKMSLQIPVNVAYNFDLGSDVTLRPYTGFNLGVNLLGKAKDDGASLNFFDKDDVAKDFRWNRVQGGWQIGVGADWKNIYLGIEYGIDFNELAKKLSTSTLTVNVGYQF